jgi:CheY-like chemotaxis protein
MDARPVFLIDSDNEWCASVCRFLEPHGIAVVVRKDLSAALQAVSECGQPSAFVMDIAGRDANQRSAQSLRNNESLRHIPVAYLKKSAALDALLMMVTSSAAASYAA